MSAERTETPARERADPTIAHLSANRFSDAARKALGDAKLRNNLRRATDLFSDLRQTAVDSVSEWEALRERARQIKEATLSRLDHYLEQLVANVEAAGVQVHFARDATEACRVITELSERFGARTIVKGKSMTTEEIGLNGALEAAEFAPIETDLGEWIIQLAGETPSHIIAPAIHKSKEQIDELFTSELGTESTDDIGELCAIARRILRKSFCEAELGISGVNFAIAETGSLLVLENEGNIRMCTSLPRRHLAVMGIEKVLPRFEDLEVFLRLLPRSGTGQQLTTYQSIFTGPKRSSEDEGPEELHLLVLDNGRTALLGEHVTRQSLACIRCGACLNVCPVYQQVGGHAYGSVYPGPIGAVITPQLAGIEKAATLPFASTLCGACRDVCPVKIDLPQLLLHLRARVVSGSARAAGKRRLGERMAFRAWAFAMSSRARYRLFTALARRLRGLARFAPPLSAWRAARELPPVARRPFRALWKAGIDNEEARR